MFIDKYEVCFYYSTLRWLNQLPILTIYFMKSDGDGMASIGQQPGTFKDKVSK